MSRKWTWTAAAVVVTGLATLVLYKETTRADSSTPDAVEAAEVAPSVVLVADPREAESSCGCGKIIRRVRAAKAEGVSVLEVEPGSEVSREYRATVNPTVLFLNDRGEVVSRFEGEGEETIVQLDDRLDELERS